MTDYPTSPCRTCQAPIIWAKTLRDKSIPVDSAPTTTGNIQLRPRDGVAPLAEVLPVAQRFGKTELRMPHHATCPQGSSWRRERRAGTTS